jgi:hypothetical protein
MSDLTAASENAAVGAIITASTTYYLSLHTADPTTTGASEVTGGSYVRQIIQFGAAAGGVMTSTDAQAFTSMPSEGGNLYIGLWTASSGGTYKWGSPAVAVTGPVASGATVSFAIGAVTATVS